MTIPTIDTDLQLGDEFPVNTTTSSNEQFSAVTALADGGFVVTWSSFGQDDSGFGIYGQRFAANGDPLDNEFQVNTTTTGNQIFSTVTALADGGFVVTWSSFGQDDSGFGIYGQRFDANGDTVDDEFQVNTTTISNQQYSAVTALADGGFVVTWSSNSQDGSDYGIYGQRFAANGDPLDDEFQVNTTTTSNQQYSAVTALANGGFVVTWSSNSQDGSDYGIYGQRFDANGDPVDDEFRVNTTTTGTQQYSAVTALADGGFVVTWGSNGQDGDGYGIYGQRFNANGDTVGAEFRVNTTTSSDQQYSAVTALADGGFVVAWSSLNQDNQDDGDWGIYSQRFNADGDPIGDETLVNQVTAGKQLNENYRNGGGAIDTLADGRLVFTWYGNGNSDDAGVYARIAGVFKPSLGVNNTVITLDEGQTATNSGTLADTDTDTVSLTASVGTVSDNGDGTWSWNFDTSDGPDETQTVTITATDSDDAVTTTTFELTVNNVAPSLGVNNTAITLDEGQTATNSGTFADLGADTVSLTASVGTVSDNGDGTWSWNFDTSDGPDDTQTVTITATDSDGAVTTTTFELTVNNVAPSLGVNNTAITLDEGQTATNSGTFADLGADTVTLVASVGTVSDNGDGTWSWNFDTSDGPDETQTVTITATDSDGAVTATTFELTVNNVAPSLGVNNTAITLDEGQTATNSGTFADTENDTVTLAASVGTVSDNGDGTWSWNFDTSDGPDETQTVTITATDSDGDVTTTTFELTVNNVAPSLGVNNTAITLDEGQTATNSGTFADLGADTVSLTASVGTVSDNGDGTWSWNFDTSDGPDETQTVTITATDSDDAVTTTTFELTVNNVAPSLGVNNTAITLDEGQTATNSGTFADLGADTVSLTASVGTVSDNGDGTWSWNFDTSDGPDETQTVTITATDSDGAVTTTTFELTVNNVAPSLGVANSVIRFDEGQTVTNSGTFADLGADTVTLVASVGTVSDNGDGMWSWNFDTSNGPDDTQIVTITATDSDGAVTTTTFELTVNRVAPNFEAANSAIRFDEGQTATNNGTLADFGANTVSLTASVGTVSDNGDGAWSWNFDTSDGPDETQTVTITATDSDGAVTTTTFELTINNVAPSLGVANSVIRFDEGQTVTNSGTFADLGADTVLLTASVGTVSDNGDGTWSWNFDTSDGPDETQTVTITATDSDGAVTTTTFELTVNRVAPSFGAANLAIRFDEGQTATNSGTLADFGANTVSLTASVGTVSDNSDGTWSWNFDTSDGPDETQTVTITATDSDDAVTTTTFQLTVNNVAPSLGVANSVIRFDEGQTVTNSGTFADLGADTVLLTASVGTVSDNGDGTWSWNFDTSDGPDETQTVTITATDSDDAVTTTTFQLTVNRVDDDLLVNQTGQYVIEPDDDTEPINVTMDEIPIGPTSIDGWLIVGVEPNADGSGYQVIWKSEDGQFTQWQLNEAGELLEWSYIDEAAVIGLEPSFNQDLNGDGMIGGLIEQQGNADLLLDQTGQYLIDPDGDVGQIGVTNAGTPTGSESIPGWLAIGVEPNADGSGYQLIWKSDDGQFTQWQLNDVGQFVDWRFLNQTAVIGLEPIFKQDLNADGTIGGLLAQLGINNPAITLNEGQTATNSGTFADLGADIVTLSASVGTVNDNGDGTWSWSFDTSDGPDDSQTVTITAIDSDGATSTVDFQLTVNNLAPILTVNNLAPTVNQNSNGDETVSGLIEQLGNADLLINETGQYLIDPDGATGPIGITNAGTPIGSASIAGWSAIGVEPKAEDAPGYQLIWKSNDGQYTQWQLDDAGQFMDWSYLNEAAVIGLEPIFNQDLNEDGTVSGLIDQQGVDNPAITADEGQTATNSGTFTDPGTDTVSLTASVGTVTDNGNGTWTWNFDTNDGPDDSQLVTISATDSDGAVTTTSFQLTVNNLAPSLRVNNSTIRFNEGQTVTNSGTVADLGADNVSLATSIGTVNDNGNGTWTWNFDTNDGDDDSQTVTISATDSDGAISTTTFQIAVNDLPPSFAVNNSTIRFDEGQTATNSGTLADLGTNTVALTASVGTVTDNGNGTWTWNFDTNDGPDDSQLVTISATDSDGAVTTTSFQLTVNNLAPSLGVNNSTIRFNEGQTVTNSGTVADLGADNVSLAASIGTVNDNGNGTWTWNFDTNDGDDDSQTVTISATDSDGAISTTTFQIAVNDLPPSFAVNNSTIRFDEGQTATNSGTLADLGTNTVALTASVGTVTDNGNGTWTWNFDTNDGPDDSQLVTISATDSDGAVTTTSFQLTVNNLAPSLGVDNSAITLDEGQTATNSGTVADLGDDTVLLAASVGTVNHNGGGTWSWSFDTSNGPDDSQTVTITATDSDGAVTTTTFQLTINDVDADLSVSETGQYFIEPDGDADPITVTMDDIPIGSTSIDGWTVVGAEPNADDSGYQLVWKSDDGRFTQWQLDEAGELLEWRFIDEATVISLEPTFNHDLNGDGTIGGSIEQQGNADLLISETGQYFIDPDGATGPIGITNAGAPTGSASIAGWLAIGVEQNADGSGYQLIWKSDDGQFTQWQLNNAGQFVDWRFLNQAAVIGLEPTFKQDLNGDSTVNGLVEQQGNTDLLINETGQYLIDPDGATDQIGITNGGTPIGSASIAGWSAIGVEPNADGSGYRLIWTSGDGQFTQWQLDAAGQFVDWRFLNQTAVIGLEPIFNQDLNANGTVGGPIEQQGNTDLLINETGQYLIDPDGVTGPIGITSGGTPIGSASIAGWSAIGVEQLSSDEYQLIWQNTSLGQFSEWRINAAGAYVTGTYPIADSTIIGLEPTFGQDLNGDALVG